MVAWSQVMQEELSVLQWSGPVRGTEGQIAGTNFELVLEKLRQLCADEWGLPYPRPDHVKIDNGEYVIHFSNHEHDRNPSTYVRGRYKTIDVQGTDAPKPTKGERFFLPCGMTAQELVNYVCAHCQISSPLPDEPLPSTPYRTPLANRENLIQTALCNRSLIGSTNRSLALR